jgi:hypothetical protein
MLYPSMELLRVDGGIDGGARSPRRNELLHALREAQNGPLNDTAAWAAAPETVPAAPKMFAQTALPVRKDYGAEVTRTRDEEARVDSARQALSVLMGSVDSAGGAAVDDGFD